MKKNNKRCIGILKGINNLRHRKNTKENTYGKTEGLVNVYYI